LRAEMKRILIFSGEYIFSFFQIFGIIKLNPIP
jgi:hypothetical protein